MPGRPPSDEMKKRPRCSKLKETSGVNWHLLSARPPCALFHYKKGRCSFTCRGFVEIFIKGRSRCMTCESIVILCSISSNSLDCANNFEPNLWKYFSVVVLLM